MIEITTSNSTNVNELLFDFGNLRDEVMFITMTTPALTPFHQKIFAHAKSAKRDLFSSFSFLKFQIPHFAFPNKIPPLRPLREPISSANPKFKIQNPRASASRNRGSLIPSSLNPLTPRYCVAAFTLIELLAVITVIGILAGLTLGAAGAVRRHGATSTAKAEVAALQAACDRYYADYNSYPTTTNSMPDPSSDYSPSASTYTSAGQVLFTNLFGTNQYNLPPSTKRYFEPKPTMVSSTTNANPYFIDPWGGAYGYNSNGTNAPLIWSTANQKDSAGTKKWITSWPKL
jgi:prepilin-type N-terminal cleavage/methylation domain-containing protein